MDKCVTPDHNTNVDDTQDVAERLYCRESDLDSSPEVVETTDINRAAVSSDESGRKSVRSEKVPATSRAYSPVTPEPEPNPRPAEANVVAQPLPAENTGFLPSFTDWHFQLAGYTWIILDHFEQKGNLVITDEDLAQLRPHVPPSLKELDVTALVLVVLQTLARSRNAHVIFQVWSKRAGKIIVPREDETPRSVPTLRPWITKSAWNFGSWGLALRVIARFLSQREPVSEGMFCQSLQEMSTMTEGNFWAVEVMALVLYMVLDQDWFWPVMFG